MLLILFGGDFVSFEDLRGLMALVFLFAVCVIIYLYLLPSVRGSGRK